MGSAAPVGIGWAGIGGWGWVGIGGWGWAAPGAGKGVIGTTGSADCAIARTEIVLSAATAHIAKPMPVVLTR